MYPKNTAEPAESILHQTHFHGQTATRESASHILKLMTQWKPQTLTDLILLYYVVMAQYSDIKRAVIPGPNLYDDDNNNNNSVTLT